MNFNSVAQELKKYLLSKGFFALLLPFANILMFTCVILRTINIFLSIDAIIMTLVGFLFYLAIVLLLANEDYKNLSIGLGVQSCIGVYSFMHSLIKYQSFSFSTIINIAVYGYLAYIAFKKSQR